MMKKRFLISGLVICMVGFWSGCGDNRTIVSESEVSMANPFVDCDSMEEGERLAGFRLRAPESLDGYGERLVRVIKDELLELQYEYSLISDCVYTKVAKMDYEYPIYEDRENAVIRKGKGQEDISGDYNVYTDVYQVKILGEEVTLKGNDGRVDLALWTLGEYSYSVSVQGLTEDAMIDLVKKVY